MPSTRVLVRAARTIPAVPLFAVLVALACANPDATAPALTDSTRVDRVSVEITPSLEPLSLGETRRLVARVVDSRGTTLDRPVTWTSRDPAVATVEPTGTVTGVGAGTTRVIATAGSAADSIALTVRAPVPLEITPNAASVALGRSLQLTVTSAGASVAASGATIRWSSSDSTIATVDADGVVSTNAIGDVTLMAIMDGVSATAAVKVTKNNVASITVTPGNSTLLPGATVGLTATLVDENGYVITGRAVKWSSSSPAVATVASSGVVTGVAKGIAIISATADKKSASATITVLDVPVATVSVSLGASTLPVGQTTIATATLKDSSGAVLTGRTLAWQSSNSALATVNASGLVTAIAQGSVTISAISEGKIGSAPLTVAEAAPAQVAISPTTTELQPGTSQQLAATVTDASGNPVTKESLTWASSNATVATVSTTGLVTAVAAGSAVITATSGGVSGTAAVAVDTPVASVASVTVTLQSASLYAGQTTQAAATVRDGAGNIVTGRSITWTTSSTSLATVSSTGVVTAVAAGSVAIMATVDGVTGAQTLSVLAVPVATVSSVSLSSPSTSLSVGQTLQLVIKLFDANGQALSLDGRTIGWSSSSSAIAQVSATGLVTGMSAGTATITATCDGVSGSVTLTVTSISTSEVTIPLGTTIQTIVDAYPAGTAFVLAAGTHRRQTIVPKAGDRFRGEAGAVLDGEGATRYAVRGWNGSRWVNDVVVRDLVITRYVPPSQDGAVSAGNAPGDATSGWVIDNVEVSYSTYYGVRIGDRMRLRNSRIHHNGTLNVGGGGVAVLVENNEISYGNYLAANDPGFEAGGTKFVLTDSLVVRGNYVHDNVGPGLWTDTDNINSLIEGNRVERNTREGIVHEISYRAVIRNNTIRDNGWGDAFRPVPNWLWNAGIGVHASPDVEVYGNTLSGNFNGIAGVQQNRGSGRYGPYLVSNLFVHDNNVTQNQPMSAFPPGSANAAAGIVDDTGTNGAFSRNNRYAHNTYYLLSSGSGNSPGFEWLGGWKSDTQWRGYGNDVDGTFNR